jgi:chromatin segregation and condensation protein Rec8/ScpA/Scc1 (kleisin family)
MATLECARQRLVEARQHEQFGDVLLRYREDEERAPTPGELPSEPVEETKKRRRRLPLVTWHPPERGAQPEQQELDLDLPDEDVVIETDEQRFHRELEETCAVEAVLRRTADLEASFAAFQTQQQLDAELAKKPASPEPVQATTISDNPHLSAETAAHQIVTVNDKTARPHA